MPTRLNGGHTTLCPPYQPTVNHRPIRLPPRLATPGIKTYFNRNAFNTTTRELTDIPSAASQGEINPNAANGKATRL